MADRVLELRVHGVSNTPPDQILGLRPGSDPDPPPPLLVAGDATTGFYRSTAAAAEDPVVVEAYSWGQLTSGARTARDVERALWTVLLPFTLANVALHARPGIPPDPDTERWHSRSGLAAWLIRLFCLSLTGTLVLTFAGVGVDLIGWQCVDSTCLGRIPGPWAFLGRGWWSEGARALAVGLVVPVGLLVVLGLSTWRTYQYEAEMPTTPLAPDPATSGPRATGPVGYGAPDAARPEGEPQPAEAPPEALTNPLQDPTFWCGEGQLRRAAVLHLSTGVVIAAAVALGPVLAMDPPRGLRAALAVPTVAAMVGVVLIAVVALARPWLTRRAGATPLGRWSAAVAMLAGAALLGTVLVLLLPDGPAGTPLADLRPPPHCGSDPADAACRTDRSLPGFDWIISWYGTGQFLLLIAIGGISRSGRRALAAPTAAGLLLVGSVFWTAGWLPGAPAAPVALDTWMVALVAIILAGTALLLPRARSSPGGRPLDPHVDLAWGGRGPAVLAGFGWMLSVANSAGLFYWVSDRLDDDATPSGLSAISPPVPVLWAGIASSVALVGLLGVALRVLVLFVRLRRQEHGTLTAAGHGLSAHDLRRCRDVSAYQALHRLVGEHALRLTGWYAAAATVLVTLGCVAVLSPARPDPTTATGGAAVLKAVADIGDSLLGWLPVLVATLGLLVYRNEAIRRTVGVVWDVGTFWPRAAHPLAPPSYAERAVPELETRTAGLLGVAENDPRGLTGIILSGHSQGAVICAAVIFQLPAQWRRRIWFFSYGCQLTRLYGRVFPAYFGPDRLPELAGALRRDGAPGWTNFWRDTDPLGWPVDVGEQDVTVRDPEALHPSGGEVADPPIRNHSGYPEASEFHRERSRVAWLLRRGIPAPRRGSG